jgi:deazaflavin-dependent oxidoreductase (nitroreductase family)
MDWLKRFFNRVHVALYRVSKGRVGGRLLGMDILLLSTRGRRSGRRRTTPLAYFREGDCVFVVGADAGSPRHPGWYHNLRADPRCQLQIGSTRRGLDGRVAQGQEHDRLYAVFRERAGEFASQYEAKCERSFPVVVFHVPTQL